MSATPGPYELYDYGTTIVVGDVATHTDLAEFFYADEHTVSTMRDEALANAKLFRAAPDLLLALKLALKQIEDVESVLNDHNLQVYGWHMNGAPESAATFFDQNNCGAVEVGRAAIERATT